jgi:hypothetical protein
VSTGSVADSSNLAHYGKVSGVSLETILNGFSGAIAVVGEVQNLGWSWSPGDSIFLNGSGLSPIPPAVGFSQKIGTVKNSTTICVELEVPVLL